MDIIEVGVTGRDGGTTARWRRYGMPPSWAAQVAELDRELTALFVPGAVLHHGDCTGIDALAHAIGRRLGYWIVVHPPENPVKRAWCQGDDILPVKPYMDRNDDVARVDVLLACPEQAHEVLRSGVWATVRRGRRHLAVVRVIPPEPCPVALTGG
jgi:hypothetical protein